MAKGKKENGQEAQGKHPGGRPTAFKPEYCRQAEKLCRLGATDKELADFFGVVEQTINNWKDIPEFLESLKKGKDLSDANVADRLYKRAMGYSHRAVKIFNDNGEPMRVDYIEHYPPDTTAAIFWLKNRQPKKWRDKIEQGFTNGEGEDVSPITIFQLPDNGRTKDNSAARGVSNESPQQSG
jgi:hypothetical protein